MNKRERVVTALKRGIPDKVPYMYNTVMQDVQEGIVGHKIDIPTYTGLNNAGWLGSYNDHPEVIPELTCVPEVAQKLDLDAITIQVLPPMFVRYVVKNGDACIAGGIIDDEEVLAKCKAAMPDPDDEKLFRKIEKMISEYRGDLAMGCRIRCGASPTILSMGMENLAISVADEDDVLPGVIEMYTSWAAKMNKNLSELDFDFFWTFDDIAFTDNLMVSPSVFRQYFKDGLTKAVKAIDKPVIFHSDGNYSAVLDDIIDLGVSAIHPIERIAIDSQWLVDNYKDKLAFVGNVDINHILHDGTREEVFADVKSRMDLFGKGGGYIICDSNSIPSFCRPENIIWMSEAVKEYRNIY